MDGQYLWKTTTRERKPDQSHEDPPQDDGSLPTPTTKPFRVGLMTTSIDIVIGSTLVAS